MYKVKKAFTLAELLITLAVIGVVAAVVIPNLINSSNESEWHVALKKSFAEFTQATQLIMRDNGGTLVNIMSCHTGDDGVAVKCVGNVYSNYMTFIRKCPPDTGCWPDITYKYLSGKPYTKFTGTGGFKAVTNNGVLIAMDIYWNSNSNVYLDINGERGPNTMGKDLYYFQLSTRGFQPKATAINSTDFNIDTGKYGCNLAGNPEATGGACSKKYLME